MREEKELTVNDERRGLYKRRIAMRPVTFVCAFCGNEATESVYPGPEPKYCNDCIREAKRRGNAERQRAYRARQKAIRLSRENKNLAGL